MLEFASDNFRAELFLKWSFAAKSISTHACISPPLLSLFYVNFLELYIAVGT